MRLGNDLVRQTLGALPSAKPERTFRPGRIAIRAGDRSAAPLASRVKILSLSGARCRVNIVTLRNFNSSGVAFADSSYWLDGERFLLFLPSGPDDRCRAVLCSVTHWEAVSAGVYRISAQFIRLVMPPGEPSALAARGWTRRNR